MTYLLSFRRFTEILLGTLDFSSSRNDKPGSYFVTIPNSFSLLGTQKINNQRNEFV